MCLSTYTDISTETLDVIHENVLIKLTGKGQGCVFLLCATFNYKPFTMIWGRRETGSTKAMWEGKLNSYPVPSPLLLLRFSAVEFNQQFKVRVDALHSPKHSFQFN